MTLIDRIKALAVVIAGDVKKALDDASTALSKVNSITGDGYSTVEAQSAKIGDMSPKIAVATFRHDLTYELFGYNPDGSRIDGKDLTVSSGAGYVRIPVPQKVIPPKDILFINARVYCKLYGNAFNYIPPEKTNSGTYIRFLDVAKDTHGNALFMYVYPDTAATAKDGNLFKSGQKLLDNESYLELSVIYKVD